MPLPSAVERLATERLDAVDAAVPGLLTALWVTGSAASGDFRPGFSDVDFVAATARVPTEADLDALVEVHPGTGEPHWDGLYVPVAALADPPSAEQPAPHVVGGMFSTGPCGYCTPVGWLELRLRGVPVRGPAPAGLVAAPDPAVLRDWLLGNLRGYWSDQAAAIDRLLADRPAGAPLSAEPVIWTVLGAPRLLATLETGEVISKTAAGRYAAERFPDFAGLAERCVAARAGGGGRFTAADGRAAAALTRAVLAAAEQAAVSR